MASIVVVGDPWEEPRIGDIAYLIVNGEMIEFLIIKTWIGRNEMGVVSEDGTFYTYSWDKPFNERTYKS